MKKMLSVVLLGAILLTFFGCGLFTSYSFVEQLPALKNEKTLDVNVSKATVSDQKGKSVELSYSDIETMYLNLDGAEFDRKKQNAGENYEYKIVLSTVSGGSEIFYVYSATDFYYDGYMYESLTGGVDLTFFDRLFG